ncbi:3-beta-hydroxy-delta-5-steroid dehydrogenase [Aureococcus anophagefferens]|nr:3-beta-hydroxy-delta-5-steroid dehydrogenase [Aureococcus anophagefferens]
MGTASETASAQQRAAAAETASAQQRRTAETASATAAQHTSTPQRPKMSLADATRLAEAGDACAMRDVGCALLRRGAAGDSAAGVALLERCVASSADAAVLSGVLRPRLASTTRLGGVATTARASACLAESAACGNAQALALRGGGSWSAAAGTSANASNPLSDGFSGTRGVVVHFTRDALGDGAAFATRLRGCGRFLGELLGDRCNAFVFNILVIPPGRAAAADGAGGVGSHVDQTLIQSTTIREQTAFHVSVGYMRVPDGLAGGELVLDGRAHHPAEGDVLTFRGDLAHKVRPFCGGGAASCDRDADPAKARVSFVLEQYRLPPASSRGAVLRRRAVEARAVGHPRRREPPALRAGLVGSPRAAALAEPQARAPEVSEHV